MARAIFFALFVLFFSLFVWEGPKTVELFCGEGCGASIQNDPRYWAILASLAALCSVALTWYTVRKEKQSEERADSPPSNSDKKTRTKLPDLAQRALFSVLFVGFLELFFFVGSKAAEGVLDAPRALRVIIGLPFWIAIGVLSMGLSFLIVWLACRAWRA